MNVGDNLLPLTAPSTAGTFDLAEHKGRWVVFYFYPKDNTSGCTLEAKSLRDGREELARMGFRIIGRDETDGMGKPYPILHLQLPEAENGNK